MEPSKFGLWSVMGIAAPGAILTATLACGLVNVTLLQGRAAGLEQFADVQWLLVAGFLLFSYLFGNLLQLHSSDRVDSISGRTLELKFLADGTFRAKDVPLFRDVRERVLAGNCEDVPEGFDEWLRSTEAFPYPACEMRMFAINHPPEVLEYFRGFRDTLARSRKGFFDYCKMVVASREARGSSAMLQEVRAAEGLTRFFAGTYFALRYAAALIIAFQLWLVGSASLARGRAADAAGMCGLVVLAGVVYKYLPIANVFRRATEPESAAGEATRARYSCMWLLIWWLYAVAAALTVVSGLADRHMTASFTVAFATIFGAQSGCALIQENFRRLRIKEVDRVFEAFYLGSR
jgi:hypothetical protein